MAYASTDFTSFVSHGPCKRVIQEAIDTGIIKYSNCRIRIGVSCPTDSRSERKQNTSRLTTSADTTDTCGEGKCIGAFAPQLGYGGGDSLYHQTGVLWYMGLKRLARRTEHKRGGMKGSSRPVGRSEGREKGFRLRCQDIDGRASTRPCLAPQLGSAGDRAWWSSRFTGG